MPCGRMPLALDLRHLGGDRLGDGERLLVLAHQDDPLDDVVLVTPADDPEPGPVADDHLRHVAEVDRVAR